MAHQNKDPESEKKEFFPGPMVKNQTEEEGITPTSELPRPYQRDEESIL